MRFRHEREEARVPFTYHASGRLEWKGFSLLKIRCCHEAMTYLEAAALAAPCSLPYAITPSPPATTAWRRSGGRGDPQPRSARDSVKNSGARVRFRWAIASA